MTIKEFNQERKISVSVDGGDVYDFSSYPEMLGSFMDVKNTETWATAHEGSVFVSGRFDRVGRIVERFATCDEAANYAEMLNEYFAICEEFDVTEE